MRVLLPGEHAIAAGLLICLQREIILCSLEQVQVALTGNVAVQILTNTLRVAHLTEDTAIGRGDAFNGPNGTIGVEVHIHGGVAGKIHILGSDLSVGSQLVQQFFGAQEAAFKIF